jgi:hypothetical protein
MSEEQVVDNNVITDAQGEPQRELRPEEQEAIERYRESQQSQEERGQGMPEGYNEDGTPQEELIAGKFKSQEDLLAAYQELEKKMGQPKEEPQQVDSAETQDTQEEPAGDGSFTTTKYEQEFVQNGGLSDDSYAELEAKGFTRQQVDAYIKGQEAYANSVRDSVYNSVGGQQEYMEVINWASENLPPQTIKEYNDAVDSLDQTKVLQTLEYMKLKKDQSAPREARRLEGNAPASGIQPYPDKNAWQRDMTNRLYGKDAKYTNMVDQRYLASRKKGIL